MSAGGGSAGVLEAALARGERGANRIGFGAMRITGPGIWGEPPDPGACRALLRRAVELGVSVIDTADSYGPEVSESLIAEALHPYPPELVIATKGGLVRPGPSRWVPNGRPEHLRAACEGSLRRLRVERIDLYQLHRPDPGVPLEESVGALAELRREGKIRDVGVSNVTAGQLEKAREVTDIVSVQNRFNLADRRAGAVLAACERLGLAFLPWAPLEAGTIRGPVAARIASRHGVAPAQVALAWLLHTSPAIIPIPGTASAAHLEANMAAADLRLDDEELEALDDAAPARWRSQARSAAGRVRRAATRLRR
jgi:pyridoxine 4-dehydrogenase